MPELLKKGEVASGNAVIGTAVMIASALGYPLAAVMLLIASSTTPLFLLDAGTFLVAAALTLGIGNVGGGVAGRQLTGAFRVAWSVSAARWPLALSAAAAFCIAMTAPTLVVLAYHLSNDGARTYTGLLLITTAGMVIGNFVFTWRRGVSAPVTTLTGLGLMAAFSLGVAFSPWVALAAMLLFVASAGNSIYVLGNRSELQEAALSDQRGSVMITRFAVTQTCLIAGSAAAGLVASQFGPQAVFAVIGVGLMILAWVAFRHYHAQQRQRPTDAAEATDIEKAVHVPVGAVTIRELAKRG